MKILVAHNFYQQPGGEDQCVAAEIAMLKAHGHEVIFYHLHNDAIHGMNRLKLSMRTVWNQSVYHELQELIRLRNPQVVHFHNTFPLISPAAYYAARAKGVAVVQTLHNFRLLCPNALFFRNGQLCEDCLGRTVPISGIVHKCYRASRSASVAVTAMLTAHRALGTWRHAVDQYIALTEFSRSKFIAGGLPPEKVSVKSNFMYPDPGAGPGTGAYGIFVGRLSAEKGIETLLAAWTQLDGSAAAPLKIVGDGPLAPLIAQAAARGSSIHWLGSRPLEEVLPLLGEALFLVLPSQCYENFPRVLIEAFAKGTPVIASRLGAMAEVVDHGRTGLLFRPGDPGDLAAQVRQFLSDGAARLRMRRTARRQYEQKYAVQSNHRALMAIYALALRRAHQLTND